jgi:general secretion pathway protein A
MFELAFHSFGLRENPFHVSPDPRFFFSTRAHGSALASLKMGMDTGRGFIVLTGEAGTGKTILLHIFLNWLRSRQQSSCYLFQCQLKSVELFELILNDFGVPCNSRRKDHLLAALKQWLVQHHAFGDSPVLVIDEAQAISLRTLDRLRMLLDLESPGGKLLQIVLAGQPGLDDKLRKPELRQLRGRITLGCALGALSMEETAKYVTSRLDQAGAGGARIFSDESLEAVHMCAEGVPRVVNLLCEHALLSAFAERQTVVNEETISQVASTLELVPQPVFQSRQVILPCSAQPARPRANVSEQLSHDEHEAVTSGKHDPEPQTAPRVATNVEEAKPAVRQESEPAWKVEERPLASVAGAVAAVEISKPQLSQSPIPIRTPRKLPERGVAKQGANGLPVNWARPSLTARFLGYCRAVEQAFVRDFRQFLQGWAQVKRVTGPGSHRV